MDNKQQEVPKNQEARPQGGVSEGRCVCTNGVCMHVNDNFLSWALGAFHTCFYNHARRLRLEKLLYIGVSRSPNGFFKCFWIQVAVSLLKPPHGGYRSKTAITYPV